MLQKIYKNTKNETFRLIFFNFIYFLSEVQFDSNGTGSTSVPDPGVH